MSASSTSVLARTSGVPRSLHSLPRDHWNISRSSDDSTVMAEARFFGVWNWSQSRSDAEPAKERSAEVYRCQSLRVPRFEPYVSQTNGKRPHHTICRIRSCRDSVLIFSRSSKHEIPGVSNCDPDCSGSNCGGTAAQTAKIQAFWGPMRLYSGTTKSLIEDSTFNRISTKLKDAFFQEFRFQPSVGEVNSWNNSLRAVSQVFQTASLLDHGVLLELQLPLTSKRLDCLVSGYDLQKAPNAVVVELKQWEGCTGASGKNEVSTFVAGRVRGRAASCRASGPVHELSGRLSHCLPG